MTRLFIAGATGQVALALAEDAKARELDFMCAGRPDFDLANPESLDAAIHAFRPTAIINAAAYTAVDAAESHEAEAFAVNCTGAAALAAVAAQLDVPFLHLSTDYVFAGDKTSPYVETDPTGPQGAYGRTKLAGEQAIQAANPKAIILRTAWVYSPFGKNFVKTMLTLAENRDVLTVVADQRGNPTSAHHIAAALLDMIGRIETTGWRPDYAGVFHIAGTGDTTWHGFATEVIRLAGMHGHPVPTVKPISTAEFPTPAKRPANSRLDCGKLEKIFGIRLPDWHLGAADCVDRLMQERQRPA